MKTKDITATEDRLVQVTNLGHEMVRILVHTTDKDEPDTIFITREEFQQINKWVTFGK